MKKILGVTFVILILLITGFANSTKITIESNEKEKIKSMESQQWTIMVYLDGDNNLQDDMEYSIGWLEFNGFNEKINIVAQFDSYDLFEGIRRYKVTENGAEIVDILEERSMGDEDTIVNFVSWAKNRYPAEKYCLVLSDHGVGWRNGFLRDETDIVDGKPDYISMIELKSALNRIKENVLENQKMNLLVLDACQMGMIEVYYQIRGTTKVCLASPDMTRGGSPFHMIFDELYEDVSCNESVLAKYFYWAYKAYYYYIPLAIYDLEKLTSKVIDSLNDFSSELIDNYNNCKNEIKNAIKKTRKYNGVGGYITHYRDLYDFADEISKNTCYEDIKMKANKLKNDLIDCEIYPSDDKLISIYLPVFDLKYKYDPSYSDIDLCKDSSWYDFVLKTRHLTSIVLSKLFVKTPLIFELFERLINSQQKSIL